MASSDLISLFGMTFPSAWALGAAAAALALAMFAMWLAVAAIRFSAEGRIARAEAEAKLSAARELSAEVSRLRAQVEEAVLHHNSAVTNAFLMHNDACAATRTTPLGAPARAGGSLLSDAGAAHAHGEHAPAENAAAFRARARAELAPQGTDPKPQSETSAFLRSFMARRR